MKDVRLREQKQHGMPDFPVQYYYVDVTHPRYEMTLHWHSEFEIVRVKEGELRLFVNNDGQRLRAGDIAFIGSEVMHRAEPRNAVYECVVFDLNMLCRDEASRAARYILPLLSSDVKISKVSQSTAPALAEATNALFACLEKRQPYYELKVYATASEIIYTLYADSRIKFSKKQMLLTPRNRAIINLIEWIEDNYTEHITLSKLSEVGKMGEKYLCRVFKEYTGSTPVEYVNRMRIEHACMMMAERFNVTEAALESGFNDVSYFSKIFKRYKGITPREYRKSAECHDTHRSK